MPYPLLSFLSVPLCCVRWVGKGQRGCWKQSESEGNEPNKSSSCPCLLPARAHCLPSSLQLCTFTLLSCRKPCYTNFSKYSVIVFPLTTIKDLCNDILWLTNFVWFTNYIKNQNVQISAINVEFYSHNVLCMENKLLSVQFLAATHEFFYHFWQWQKLSNYGVKSVICGSGSIFKLAVCTVIIKVSVSQNITHYHV